MCGVQRESAVSYLLVRQRQHVSTGADNNCRRSEKLTETEMRPLPPVIYEEPIFDPLTQENLAYSHIQQLQPPIERSIPI